MWTPAYANHTLLNPLGALLIISAVVLALLLPKRYVLVSLLLLACFVSPAQRVTIGGLDFNGIRIVVLAAWIRVLSRREWAGFRWRTLDSLFLLWAFSATAIWGIRMGTSGFIERLGSHVYEQFLIYLLSRVLVREWNDIVSVMRVAARIALVCVPFFLLEWCTERNLFFVFGGVPEITIVREGNMRCQGPFPHPIVAGVFWASWVPLFAAVSRWARAERFWMFSAAIAASFIVFATGSSTSLLALIAGFAGLALFTVKVYVRTMRLATLAILVIMQMIMENNVWHALLRLGVLTGSEGYHRYWLIENCVNHFAEWALMGSSTEGWSGPSQYDVANFYVIQAVTGGLVTLILFIGLLVISYREVGAACRLTRGSVVTSWFAWCIGVTLFVHSIAFIGLSYFGQVLFAWGLHMGLVGSLHTLARVSDASTIDPIEASSQHALCER